MGVNEREEEEFYPLFCEWCADEEYYISIYDELNEELLLCKRCYEVYKKRR